MNRVALIAVALLLPLAAHAQHQDPAIPGFELMLRQASIASLYAQAMQRELAARDARIAELEKLCGDPCVKAGPTK